MGPLLFDADLLKQATIVVDNALSPLVTASHSRYSEIPALCCFKTMPTRCVVSRSRQIRKGNKRSESFPTPEKSRWDSMSLIAVKWATMTTTSLKNISRHSGSAAIPQIDSHDSLVNVAADSAPRQPRRNNSFNTISMLDEALEVISLCT